MTHLDNIKTIFSDDFRIKDRLRNNDVAVFTICYKGSISGVILRFCDQSGVMKQNLLY